MGQDGTGKTLAARALHETASPDAPFASLDCALQDETDLAQTFEAALGGTLLLRHVSEMSGDMQAKLLQLLQQTDTAPALIATSEKHLTPGSGFRADLLYRIQVGWIDMPPLSERAADVLPIAEYLARRIARDRGEARPRFTSAARAKLLEHDWPGNISELENCIERAMLVQTDGQIDTGHIRAIGKADTGDMPTLKEMELCAITKALNRTDGNVSRAADILGVSRDTLRYRMEKFELARR
jgi:DNA-binding NtrC family response regulator